ncbi:hypothetical protein FACS189452_08890 [Bacteroidia bacterium]|nr:hypothetical protein FACS189452_08890 [Bacteroidia bacterium]
MSHSKKQRLQQNLAIIREVLSAKSATPETIELFKNYSGFGALKCVLLPVEKEEDKWHWTKSELELFPLVQELHSIIRNGTASEQEYKLYMNSIKNSVLSAFYTPTEVVQTIAQSLSNAGIQAQTILEPSAGVGQFVADFKDVFPQSKIVAYEKDLITGAVLQRLCPDEKVHVAGFETIAANNNNRFDIVTSNIPFGQTAVPDPLYSTGGTIHKQAASSVHNYFFVKALDTVREGGIVAFITSQGVADAPTNRNIRGYLMQKADLISAIRLPNNLFSENAGTDVGSDLIILQKHSRKPRLSENERLFVETQQTKVGTNVNGCIYKTKNFIFTDSKVGTDLYGKPALILTHSGGIQGIADDLATKLHRDIAANFSLDLYQQQQHTPVQKIEQPKITVTQAPPAPQVVPKVALHTQVVVPLAPKKRQAKSSEPLQSLQFDLFSQPPLSPEEIARAEARRATAAIAPATINTKPAAKPIEFSGILMGYMRIGSLVKQDEQIGTLTTNEDGDFMFTSLQLNEADRTKIADYIDVRDAYYALYGKEQTTQLEASAERERLNVIYDNFTLKYGALNNKINAPLISLDAGRTEIKAIELQQGGKFVKSDIFQKPVSFAIDIEIKTPEDALFASLNLFGNVRMEYITGKLNLSQEEILSHLDGKIFYNPLSPTHYEDAAKFLSGNIVQKIGELNTYYINHFVDGKPDERIQKSIAALEKIIPEKIPFELLDFNFGERWLPTKVYADFATYLLKTEVGIKYLPASDTFSVSAKDGYTPEIYAKYKDGDKIIVPQKDDYKLFYNPNIPADKGDAIDFLLHRLNGSVDTTIPLKGNKERLQSALQAAACYVPTTQAETPARAIEHHYNIKPLIAISPSILSLLNKRKINQHLLELNDIFDEIGLLYSKNGDYTNLFFHWRNAQGEKVGGQYKYLAPDTGGTAKAFVAGTTRYNSVWATSLEGKSGLFVCEDPIDALSYRQMYSYQNCALLAIGGAITTEQIQIIRNKALRANIPIILGNDNDIAGQTTNLKIIDDTAKIISIDAKNQTAIIQYQNQEKVFTCKEVTELVKSIVLRNILLHKPGCEYRLDVPKHKDWNDDLRSVPQKAVPSATLQKMMQMPSPLENNEIQKQQFHSLSL